jgi:serine/threonine-protein kinase
MPQDISLLLPVGTMLRQGAYRIERHLASGGFGNTYLATDVNLEAKVAIKEFYISTVNIRNAETLMVEVSNATNEGMFNDLRTKFKKEAQRIFKIQHNNVVGVHALFEELGTVYYAMDFVQGESLNDKL